MTRQQTSQHLGQLLAAVGAWASTAALTMVAANGTDTSVGMAWPRVFAVSALLSLFSSVWLALAFGLSIRATWRALRAPAASRPAPGDGRDIAWAASEWEAAFAAWDAAHGQHGRHAGPTAAGDALDDVAVPWDQVDHWYVSAHAASERAA